MTKLALLSKICVVASVLFFVVRLLPSPMPYADTASVLVLAALGLLTLGAVHNIAAKILNSETGVIFLHILSLVLPMPLVLVGYQQETSALVLPDSMQILGVYAEVTLFALTHYFVNFGLLRMNWPSWATISKK